MNRIRADHFAEDLQLIIDELVKDFICIDGKKILRAVLPKEWKGRAIVFDRYARRSNSKYTFKVDDYHPSLQYKVLYHSYNDGKIYFYVVNEKNKPAIV